MTVRTALDLVEVRRDAIAASRSPLDRAREDTMRALLPEGVGVNTGDDFDFADTVRGDGSRHGHGLLGIFDPIAPAAAAAFAHLAAGDVDGYRPILGPIVPPRCGASSRRPHSSSRPA